MLVVSGSGPDTQWFDYRPAFFQPIIRVEWELGTMFAALPDDVAGYLLSHGYARAMTEAEIEEYTAPPEPAPESVSAPEARKAKKEIDHDSRSLCRALSAESFGRPRHPALLQVRLAIAH